MLLTGERSKHTRWIAASGKINRHGHREQAQENTDSLTFGGGRLNLEFTQVILEVAWQGSKPLGIRLVGRPIMKITKRRMRGSSLHNPQK